MEAHATPSPVVPLLEHLPHIYQDFNNSVKQFHEPRFANLVDRFQRCYSKKPQFFARAPGRVNIIGEHIDYCDYAVLPAAIQQDFLMAYSINDSDEIVINNIDKDKFPQEKISTDAYQKLWEPVHWINYFLCGYKAILSLNQDLATQVTKPKGLEIMIDSHIPAAAGLSSSSAFTVCAALVTLHANNLREKVPQTLLSQLCMESERFAGTACGGMDQTISVMAEMNKAKLIEFKPTLKATDVRIPSDLCLVIANSLTPSPKVLTVGTRYNARVVECRFGVALLGLKLGLIKSKEELISLKYKNFRDIQIGLGATFEQMISHVKANLKVGGYNKQLLATELNLPNISELLQDIQHYDKVLELNVIFKVQERALHVFQEAKRVMDFKALCDSQQGEDLPKLLGKLMDESHFSCKVLYDCSSEELDELTSLARKSGALGSRLTGAGWGGCCVSLVPKAGVQSFVDNIQKEYYLKEREVGYQLWITDDLNRYVFATQPALGACILDPQYCLWM